MEEIWHLVIEEGWWKDILWKPIAHFALSGGVGLLVYWLTSTMLSRCSYGGIGTHKLLKGGFGIHHFSLSVALLFAIWVHILEDYTLDWF